MPGFSIPFGEGDLRLPTMLDQGHILRASCLLLLTRLALWKPCVGEFTVTSGTGVFRAHPLRPGKEEGLQHSKGFSSSWQVFKL